MSNGSKKPGDKELRKGQQKWLFITMGILLLAAGIFGAQNATKDQSESEKLFEEAKNEGTTLQVQEDPRGIEEKRLDLVNLEDGSYEKAIALLDLVDGYSAFGNIEIAKPLFAEAQLIAMELDDDTQREEVESLLERFRPRLFPETPTQLNQEEATEL